MKSVGIKILKDKLSSYLDLVRKGEVILVTDRDEVVAELRRPLRLSSALPDFDSFVDEGVMNGTICRPSAPKRSRLTMKDLLTKNRKLDVDALEILRASREERN